MFTLIFCSLVFNSVVAAEHYKTLHVSVPNHLIGEVLRALKTVPNIKLGIVDRMPVINEFDMNYYDEDRLQIEPSTPMPRGRSKNKMRFLTEGRLLSRLYNRRDMLTHAGYTTNTDTCKVYNRNLQQVWNKLTQYMKTENETPNNEALHNIILIIQAYLDHHNNINNKSIADDPIIDVEYNVSDINEIVSNIREMLKETIIDAETPRKIIDLVLNKTDGKKKDDCQKDTLETLISYIELAFQKYLDDSVCQRSSKNIASTSNNNINEAVILQNKKMDRDEATQYLSQLYDDKVIGCNQNALEQLLDSFRLIISRYLSPHCDLIRVLRTG